MDMFAGTPVGSLGHVRWILYEAGTILKAIMPGWSTDHDLLAMISRGRVQEAI